MSQDRTNPPSSLPHPDFFAEALRRVRTDDAAVFRPARRTLAEMAPGFVRQPVLRLVPARPAAQDDYCPLCTYWRCRCGEIFPASGTVTKQVA